MALKRGDWHSLGALAAVGFSTLLAGAGETRAQLPSPTPGVIIELRQYGVIPPPTPKPLRPAKREEEEETRPIPRGWIIGGAIAGALAIAGLLYGAARAWRSSNLFDRQYRFPAVTEVAVRLGAEKSGGHLATVRFGPGKRRAAPLKSKDL